MHTVLYCRNRAASTKFSKSSALIRGTGCLVYMKSDKSGYCRKTITSSVRIGHVSLPLSAFPSFWFRLVSTFCPYLLSLFLMYLPLFLSPVSRSVSPSSLIPSINDQGSGHENQTFTKATTISGTSQWLVCVCVCVCVAQLLNRWNAHYAADDNSVESKVCAPLYLHFFPLSFPPPPPPPQPCPHSSHYPHLSLFLPAECPLLCFVLRD